MTFYWLWTDPRHMACDPPRSEVADGPPGSGTAPAAPVLPQSARGSPAGPRASGHPAPGRELPKGGPPRAPLQQRACRRALGKRLPYLLPISEVQATAAESLCRSGCSVGGPLCTCGSGCVGRGCSKADAHNFSFGTGIGRARLAYKTAG